MAKEIKSGEGLVEHKKAILADPRARKIVADFLKYRHREWEESLSFPRQSAKRKQTR
jgi:hypothetical protein